MTSLLYIALLLVTLILTAPLVARLCAITHPTVVIPKVQRWLHSRQRAKLDRDFRRWQEQTHD